MNARIRNGMDIKGADVTQNYKGYDVVEDRDRLNIEKEDSFSSRVICRYFIHVSLTCQYFFKKIHTFPKKKELSNYKRSNNEKKIMNILPTG